MHTLREILKKINIQDNVLFDEPMKNHTTFRIGGPADVFVTPSTVQSLKTLVSFCRNNGIPFFLLGQGANILVADEGIRGIVIDLSAFSRIMTADTKITAGAGAFVSRVSEAAITAGLTGLEFLYSMPGSVGGALYMNARCYGMEIAFVVESAAILDKNGNENIISLRKKDFSYKKSPFQKTGDIILSATFILKQGKKPEIREKMDEYRLDRERKGHFLFPCAGSVFKNNKKFGKTTGRIIDSLGLKGYCIGDARVSPEHGNIIVNQGNARALDVMHIIMFLEKKVKMELGLELEREIILVGAWNTELQKPEERYEQNS
ncbi:MAG: UDP-N-acetylmuramate dehydrogenase [Spirochaetales bacterium]|nr:UDP-N-acetylmuramate dehydrogenase [Spirochaetales bacterium]